MEATLPADRRTNGGGLYWAGVRGAEKLRMEKRWLWRGGECANQGYEISNKSLGCKRGMGWADGWPGAAVMKRHTIDQSGPHVAAHGVGHAAVAGGQTGNQMGDQAEGAPVVQRPPRRAAAAGRKGGRAAP